MLWRHWWNLVCELRSACARTRTFLWMSLCLAGFSTRKELLGVTSIVRALGLEPACYDRSWTSSTARPWIWTNSPTPGALWSSDSIPAFFA